MLGLVCCSAALNWELLYKPTSGVDVRSWVWRVTGAIVLRSNPSETSNSWKRLTACDFVQMITETSDNKIPLFANRQMKFHGKFPWFGRKRKHHREIPREKVVLKTRDCFPLFKPQKREDIAFDFNLIRFCYRINAWRVFNWNRYFGEVVEILDRWT